MPNLKSVALALKELLAFNSQILRGHRHVPWARPLLRSFDILGLAAAKGRRFTSGRVAQHN